MLVEQVRPRNADRHLLAVYSKCVSSVGPDCLAGGWVVKHKHNRQRIFGLVAPVLLLRRKRDVVVRRMREPTGSALDLHRNQTSGSQTVWGDVLDMPVDPDVALKRLAPDATGPVHDDGDTVNSLTLHEVLVSEFRELRHNLIYRNYLPSSIVGSCATAS